MGNQESIPVGATWEFVAPTGEIGRVWLEDRHENGRECWLYEVIRSNGSRKGGDWAQTKRIAAEQCKMLFGIKPGFDIRFCRVDTQNSGHNEGADHDRRATRPVP